MDYESYQVPEVKAETRYGRRDGGERNPYNENYRRRSPGPYDRRGGPRNRARSRSPQMIDRYLPGDRNADDGYGPPREHGQRRGSRGDERRRLPSPAANIDRYVPGQDTGPIQIRTNPIQNPLSLDFQVGFMYFAEWWKVEQQIKDDKERARNGGRRPLERVKTEKEVKEERDKERAQIQAAYDAYKEELQVKMAKQFVLQHRSEEWFRERYIPEVRDSIRQRLMDFRHAALAQWDSDIDAGVFDEFNLEGIYKSESNGVGGVVEREEGEAVAAAEVLGVGDLVPSRGGDLRDEAALQPALLIKTLAPMVSRDKVEALCKEHLGEQDGGFKWLSLSDPNPQKKCHRIGWIMLHPEAETAPPVDRGDGRDEEAEDGADEAMGGAEAKSLLTTSEKALDAINGKTIHDEGRGDFTVHVGVHVPPREPRKKALWDLFSAPERVTRDLQLAERMVLKLDEELGPDVEGLSKIRERVDGLRNQGLLQTTINGSANAKKSKKPKRELDMDIDDGEDGEDEGEADDSEEEEGLYDDDKDDDELAVKKKTLDLLIEYLRRVHNFCLFCVFETDSVHELIRKCPGGHLRRPRASLSSNAKKVAQASASGEPFPIKRRESTAGDEEQPNSPVQERKSFHLPKGSRPDQQLQRAYNWVKTYEEKLLQILDPENADLKKLGGKPLEEGLDEELKKFVKQEDEAKFRCKVPECTKLFKGEVFWRKHVEKRHPEWFGNIKQELVLVNTYVLDPSHIAPSRSDANSNGHFPINNHGMNTGTPRGFNLANMPQMNGMPPGGFMPQPMNGFTPFPTFGNHPVQMPGGWQPGMQPQPMMMMEDPNMQMQMQMGMHQPGPMRRGGGGGGRFNNQRNNGPYARPPRYSGGGAGAGGPMSPGRGGGMMGMNGRMGSIGGKWGEGMPQAVGPAEATQGRQIKSYEDLDAVEGPGGGELNY